MKSLGGEKKREKEKKGEKKGKKLRSLFVLLAADATQQELRRSFPTGVQVAREREKKREYRTHSELPPYRHGDF